MKRRQGASLVELLAVMSACTVILSMCGALIHRSMQSHIQARAFFNVERAALRLSKQFRHDVHQAQGLTDGDSPSDKRLVQLQLPDGQTVDYRSAPRKVLRVLSQSGRTISQEEFPFGTDIQATLEQEPSPRRLTLSVVSARFGDAGVNAGPHRSIAREMPVDMQVQAIVGNNGRFQSTMTRAEDSP